MDVNIKIDEICNEFATLEPKYQKEILKRCEATNHMDVFLEQIKHEINCNFAKDFYNKELALAETKINLIYSNGENVCFEIKYKF